MLWTTYPDGDTQGTAASPLRYDGAGRLITIPGYVKSVSYNAAGNVTEIDNANGTVTSRPHDAERGWLTGIRTTSGDTVVQDDAFTRNASGKITKITSPAADQNWTYTYDDADQLTDATNGRDADSATEQAVSYDAAGNIANNTRTGAYSYDAAHPHAVSAAGSNSYTYDAAGNMTSGGGRTMTWDGDGLLATVVKGGVTTSFTYDADGARLQQTDGTATRRYLGADYEVDLTTDTTTKYVSIAGTPVARVDGANTYWVHTNVQGSIEAETDAAGVVVHRKQYRPFGEVLSTGGALPFEARGFTAERQDATGLVYLNARYYDPQLGRFISPDPTIDGDAPIGLNRYAYAANDPVNNTDHTGLSCQGSQSEHCKPGDPISRSDIVARARYWINNPPPGGYDQSGSYQDADGKQYRTDCSGYVSMAWHLTGSPGTDTIASPANGIATLIDRSQLLPGDVLDDTLTPGESSENHHIILFNGYTDATQTEFNYFSFGGGKLPEAGRAFTDPARSPTIAGHLNSNYRAFRYNHVLDDPPAGQGPAAGQNGAGTGLAPSAVQSPGATPDPAVPAPFN